MLIIRGDSIGIAVIDPSKKLGEEGQYISYSGEAADLKDKILTARSSGKEIRYYYKGLKTSEGEIIPARVSFTEIPPGHIQPFHAHDNIHEISVVESGEIIAIDSQDIKEEEKEKIKKQGTLLKPGDMVVESPGKRHTIMNASNVYAFLATIQLARIPLSEAFSADWKR